MPDVSGMISSTESDSYVRKELASSYLGNLIKDAQSDYDNYRQVSSQNSFDFQEEAKRKLPAASKKYFNLLGEEDKINEGDSQTIDKYFNLEIARQNEENERKARENNISLAPQN